MFFIYRILAFLLAPLARRKLDAKAVGWPGIVQRSGERRGHMPPGSKADIWIHAASVGEVNGIAPLVERLLASGPSDRILVSTMTPTGAIRAGELFGDRVLHRLAPLDTRASVNRWLKAVQPVLVLIAETELWPELFHAVDRRGIPLMLVNGRISPRALQRYAHFRPLLSSVLRTVDLIACQSREEAERFTRLGADPARIRVTGNLKFDARPPGNLSVRSEGLRRLWGSRPTWVAGSTHPGEEDAVFLAHRKLIEQRPDALLVIAPRHPERAPAVLRQAREAGFQVRSQEQPVGAGHSVVVIDQFGWVLPAYKAAELCFVGGSLVPVGGHNLLEPAMVSRPVIAGPWLGEQETMANLLQEHDALLEVRSGEELGALLGELMSDSRRRLALGVAAARAVKTGIGALEKTMGLIGQIRASGPCG